MKKLEKSLKHDFGLSRLTWLCQRYRKRRLRPARRSGVQPGIRERQRHGPQGSGPTSARARGSTVQRTEDWVVEINLASRCSSHVCDCFPSLLCVFAFFDPFLLPEVISSRMRYFPAKHVLSGAKTDFRQIDFDYPVRSAKCGPTEERGQPTNGANRRVRCVSGGRYRHVCRQS